MNRRTKNRKRAEEKTRKRRRNALFQRTTLWKQTKRDCRGQGQRSSKHDAS